MSTPDPQAATPPAETPDAMVALSDVARSILAELRLSLQGRVHLVSLEVRQASIAATEIVLLATLAALMVCAAWGTVLVGVYMGAVAAGIPWAGALLLVFLANLLAAGAIWLKATSLTVHFTFPATMRMLGLAPKAPPPEPASHPSSSEALRNA